MQQFEENCNTHPTILDYPWVEIFSLEYPFSIKK
jgi:hypothetical protein